MGSGGDWVGIGLESGWNGLESGWNGVGMGWNGVGPAECAVAAYFASRKQNRISESASRQLDLTRLSPARGWPYSIAPRIPPGHGIHSGPLATSHGHNEMRKWAQISGRGFKHCFYSIAPRIPPGHLQKPSFFHEVEVNSAFVNPTGENRPRRFRKWQREHRLRFSQIFTFW